MVIDTSALLAILQNEPEKEIFLRALVRDPVRLLSAASYVEAGIVLETRFGLPGRHQLILFITRASIIIKEVDQEQAEICLQAFNRFGKGKHPAGLNYGDCFSYALSTVTAEPLLYKGIDFVQTDVKKVELSHL